MKKLLLKMFGISILKWYPVSREPQGDLILGLVRIKEPNGNYESYSKLFPGMAQSRFINSVTPAIYMCSTNQWMSAGRDVTPFVVEWCNVNQ